MENIKKFKSKGTNYLILTLEHITEDKKVLEKERDFLLKKKSFQKLMLNTTLEKNILKQIQFKIETTIKIINLNIKIRRIEEHIKILEETEEAILKNEDISKP